MFRTVRPILASLTIRTPKRWDNYLALAAHSYNAAYHAGIRDVPFFIMYGRRPHPLPEHCMEAENDDNVDRLRRWKLAREAAHEGLLAAQRTNIFMTPYELALKKTMP